ncbi:3-hydroxylacyl-ACP dehydratase [Parasulfuritortus cantonensis]|uniref:3-hydroxylacyl-ACP dehydratase n=1 Tax=Parasulfuritortus cantonensis TaxID=2528202 RepID=A0A4R1BF62_9PROT|nr:3-hydroxylacyl-ACP dehydratase [Parasulfuritortus cantonensis]TCJ15779.1 3-hydroxylacyl-ACP dehydratase [Parasulfuritortus cantonensis]
MQIDKTWIASHIPHQGDMCLLDGVAAWTETTIVCRTRSHLAADNPLRHAGRLGIANGIEYAAQAMAVHGALLAGDDQRPTVGFLTSVRDVRWFRARLDDLPGELTVSAERLSGAGTNILYQFTLQYGDSLLLSGRASVMLDASGAPH